MALDFTIKDVILRITVIRRIIVKFVHAFLLLFCAVCATQNTGCGNDTPLDRAIADWEAALRINPNNAEARENIEIARQQRGY